MNGKRTVGITIVGLFSQQPTKRKNLIKYVTQDMPLLANAIHF